MEEFSKLFSISMLKRAQTPAGEEKEQLAISAPILRMWGKTFSEKEKQFLYLTKIATHVTQQTKNVFHPNVFPPLLYCADTLILVNDDVHIV